MERDEVYVPKTRSDLGIPQEGTGKIDYDEYFGDTPIYTLYMLVRQQLLAFPAYLCKSADFASGNPSRPPLTRRSVQRLRPEKLSQMVSTFRAQGIGVITDFFMTGQIISIVSSDKFKYFIL